MSFEQAAAVPIAGVTALQALRDVAQVKAGQQVLINGASGGAGIFAVLAGLMQAGELTPVIDRRYSLAEAAAAIEYLETGRARGKVVVVP